MTVILASSRENLSSGFVFATQYDSNWPPQLHRLARGLNFLCRNERYYSQVSIARKNSSDGKIEYIMASMLIVLLDVW